MPRSRTAWLANFLTYGDITCSHEGLNGCKDLIEYRNRFTHHSGDSNTGLALFDFEPYFKDFKLIIIDNKIDSAVRFSKKYYNHDPTALMEILKDRLDGLDGLHIPFNEINDNLETIWYYVAGSQFNDVRAEMLTGLNVQVCDPLSSDRRSMTNLIKNTKNYF